MIRRRVPRQDQKGEAFKRGCRKAVVGLRAVICDAVTSFRGAQKLMTWSLCAVVERWRCQRSSARNDSSVHVVSQSVSRCSHVWCFAFLFWDLRVYILRGNAEDSRYGRWPPQWDWTFTAADYCKKGKSVKQQQEGMPFKFHSWMHVVRIWTRWQLPKASNFSFFVEMFVVALY